MPKRLYKVELRGLGGIGCSMNYRVSYVVAWSSDKAYELVRRYLDKKDIGFSKDRALHNITLLAEDNEYTEIGTLLFVQGGQDEPKTPS